MSARLHRVLPGLGMGIVPRGACSFRLLGQWSVFSFFKVKLLSIEGILCNVKQVTHIPELGQYLGCLDRRP